MDTVSAYSFGNLAWMSAQSLPLIIWPSFVGSMLRVGEEHSTSLEQYFARSLGFALLALALTVVVLSGAVPLGSSSESSSSGEGISPYANAVLTIATAHHSAVGFYCYGRYTWTGETGYMLGCIGSSIFAAFGLYCVMFAGDKAMISRFHKFDQSTSGFPFKNTESYRSKKKAL